MMKLDFKSSIKSCREKKFCLEFRNTKIHIYTVIYIRAKFLPKNLKLEEQHSSVIASSNS